MALIKFAANKTIDILLDYGYHFLVMPNNLRDKEILLAA